MINRELYKVTNEQFVKILVGICKHEVLDFEKLGCVSITDFVFDVTDITTSQASQILHEAKNTDTRCIDVVRNV